MNFEEAINHYIENKYDDDLIKADIKSLGSGLVAEAFKVTIHLRDNIIKDLVFRRIKGDGMSRDYLGDKVSYLHLQHEIANTYPNHTRSRDIVIFGEKLRTMSLKGMEDVFQVMDFAAGKSYLKFMLNINKQKKLSERDQIILQNLASHLVELHKIKPEYSEPKNKNLYLRHSQDFIGSEVYLDIIDVWPTDKIFGPEVKSRILYLLSLERERIKNNYKRITRIHADFHPDNIRINEDNSIEVMDSSRAMWGERADDVACLLSNFIYFSIVNNGKMKGSYAEAYDYFSNEYLQKSKDKDIENLTPMYLAVRLIILANPAFFSSSTFSVRKKLLKLVENLLQSKDFKYKRIYELI